MNLPEIQRSFIGSGPCSVSLAPESGLNDLLVSWSRLSPEPCGFTHRFPILSAPKNIRICTSLPEDTRLRLLLKPGLTTHWERLASGTLVDSEH